jgi:hypothetical protein
MQSRNRTPLQIIGYGLYLYFLGLSFRNAAKVLSFLKIIKISPISIGHRIQKYKPKRFFHKREIKEYMCILYIFHIVPIIAIYEKI